MKNMQRNQTNWNTTQHLLTKTPQKQKYNRSKGKASTHEHLQKEWLPIEGDCNTKSSPNISHNLTRYWTNQILDTYGTLQNMNSYRYKQKAKDNKLGVKVFFKLIEKARLELLHIGSLKEMGYPNLDLQFCCYNHRKEVHWRTYNIGVWIIHIRSAFSHKPTKP